MKEKLELMKWLYENGVEPRMWANRERVLTPFKMESNVICQGEQIGSFLLATAADKLTPWFPLEQVLEELPTYIADKEGKMFWLEYRVDGTQKWDKQHIWQYRAVGSAQTLFKELTTKDSHLAALRLLKRVRGGEKE